MFIMLGKTWAERKKKDFFFFLIPEYYEHSLLFRGTLQSLNDGRAVRLDINEIVRVIPVQCWSSA